MTESTVVEVSVPLMENATGSSTIRILHVDDELGFLKAAKQILESQWGFVVDTASSVEEALEKVEAQSYDVILSDYQMPNKNGLQFLTSLREKGDNTPFIMFTGKGREEVAIKALNLGADRYINKIGDPETVYTELNHGIKQLVERQYTHNALSRSEALLRSLVEGTEDIIIVQDLEGKYLYYNASRENGLKSSDVVGKTPFDFFDSKRADEIVRQVKLAASTGKPVNVESKTVWRGKDLWFSDLTYPIRDLFGQVIATGTISRNITELKENEGKLLENDEFLNNVIDSLAHPFCVIDANSYEIVIANFPLDVRNPTEKLTCHEVFHKNKKPCSGLEHPCPLEEVKKTKKPSTLEHIHFDKEGNKIFVEVHGHPILDNDGNVVRMIEYSLDITTRKEAMDALIKSQERFKNLLDETPIGIMNLNLQGDLVYVNKRFEAITGYSKNELIGRNYTKLVHSMMLKKDVTVDLIKKQMSRTLKGEVTTPLNIQIKRKDGTARWLEGYAKAVYTSGAPVGMQAFIRDVTGRKESEADRSNLLHDLGERVKELQCLYGISKIGEKSNITSKEVVQEICNLIPPAMQYPSIACSRITLWNQEFRTKNFKETPLKQQADVKVRGKKVGVVEVCYLEKRRRIAENPFLKEEVHLIHEVAERIGKIAERKKTEATLHAREEALRTSEAKYRNIVELTPDAIATVNTKGVVTSLNDAFLKLTGYSRSEIVGKRFTKIATLRKRDLPRFLKLFTAIRRGKPFKPFEVTWQRKDGTQYLTEVRVTLLKEGGKVTSIQAIARDITERKFAERRVKESQQKFEGLFRDNPEAAVYVDPDFHILDINPRFKKLFGYSLDEVKGKPINQVVVPEDRMGEAKKLDENARKGHTYLDTVRTGKGGALIPVSISAAPIIVEGKHVGNVGIYKDISELKKTEKALKDTLEKSETLNEKLNVVGKLTRHDIRNKLSTVGMNTFLTKQQLAGNHDALQHLSEIESAISQTEKILEFARSYEKLGVEDLAPIDVGKVLNDAAMLFSGMQGITVTNDCRGLTVLADSLLQQLFYNLIDNSLKHGEKVSQIKVHYEKTGKNQLELVYEDDGKGVSKVEKEKIFAEGYGKNTGYGLHLIRKMCDVYGWAVKETGRAGKGVQFTLTIPKLNEQGEANYDFDGLEHGQVRTAPSTPML